MLDITDLLDGHLPKIRVIDVGALDLGPVGMPYQSLLDRGLVEVIGFEPVVAECDKLNSRYGDEHLFLPYVVGDGHPATFRQCNHSMTSSVFEPNTRLLNRFQNLEHVARVVERREVQTRRLDDIAEVADADYLKVDVQGAEVDVFAGASNLLASVTVIHTEIEFIPLYQGQPLFAEVDQVLRAQGFLFHTLTGTAGRAFKPFVVDGYPNQMLSQLLWAEAVYVKSFMEFDRLSGDKLLKLAVILHEAYGSFDLCALALQHYDAKCGTEIWPAYMKNLGGGVPEAPPLD